MATDLVTSLKALVELMSLPTHDPKRCGSNDCKACEWKAIADSIDWPPWREDLERCPSCGAPTKERL